MRKGALSNKSETKKNTKKKKRIEKRVTLDIAKLLDSTSNPQKKEVRVSEINRKIIKEISILTSKMNLSLFLTRFRNLDFKHKDFLLESDYPIIDDFCRASFCCIILGPHRLPVYQPGTIMFLSGVKSKCPLEVFHKNCGQNGPIIGMGCALFLAKFMSHLSSSYFTMCKNQGHDHQEFIPHIYNNALTNCLYFYSKEDAEQHGRLREIQKMLFRFDDRVMPMTREEEMQFYLSDVKAFKKANDSSLPNDDNEISEFRDDHVFYNGWGALFNENNTKRIVDNILPKFKSQILNKKGIFPDISCYKIIEKKIDDLTMRYSVNHGIKQNRNYMNEFTIQDRTRISYATYQDSSCPSEKMRKRNMRVNQVRSCGKLKREADNAACRSIFSNEKNLVIKVNGCDLEIRDFFKFDKMKLIYYQTLKQSLRPFFCNFRLSNLDIFDVDNFDLGRAVKKISKIIQPVKKIFSDARIIIVHEELKSKLENFKIIASNYDNLSTEISKALTAYRDHFLDALKEEEKSNQIKKMVIGDELYSYLEKFDYSKYEILAIRDSKMIESAFFLYSEQLKLESETKFESSSVLIEKLLNIMTNYELSVFDLSERSPVKETDSFIDSKEQKASQEDHSQEEKILFSEEILKRQNMPIYLKKKNDEDYQEYRKRIEIFLKDCSLEKLTVILGEIDPSLKENDQALDLVSSIIRHKKERNSCILI